MHDFRPSRRFAHSGDCNSLRLEWDETMLEVRRNPSPPNLSRRTLSKGGSLRRGWLFGYLQTHGEGAPKRSDGGRSGEEGICESGVSGLERFGIVFCLLYLVFFCAAMPARADDPLPTGFKADRYRNLWERNPFTLVTPVVQTQPQAFNKLVVVSWLNDGGKDSLFVQDTDTNDIERITDAPNEKGLRIVEVHANGGKDFQMVRDFEAVISNGSEQGTVKFKPEATAPVIASNPINPINPMQIPPEVGQNNQIPQQVRAEGSKPNIQPNAPYGNPNIPPQSQQTRRKRVLPSAVANGTQGTVPQPQQNPGINQGQ